MTGAWETVPHSQWRISLQHQIQRWVEKEMRRINQLSLTKSSHAEVYLLISSTPQFGREYVLEERHCSRWKGPYCPLWVELGPAPFKFQSSSSERAEGLNNTHQAWHRDGFGVANTLARFSTANNEMLLRFIKRLENFVDALNLDEVN